MTFDLVDAGECEYGISYWTAQELSAFVEAVDDKEVCGSHFRRGEGANISGDNATTLGSYVFEV